MLLRSALLGASKLSYPGCGFILPTTTRLFASSSEVFQPAPPPGTHGTPVFPDLDFTQPPTEASHQRRSDEQAVLVVTGGNRGIGKQLVQTLLDSYAGTVVACSRQIPAETEAPKNHHDDRLYDLALDLENPESIVAAGEELREHFDRVDLLLNVAGILGDGAGNHPERRLGQVESDWFLQSMQVNALGPMLWTQQLEPLLRVPKTKQQQSTTERPPSIVMNWSARVGSISDNQSMGGWYTYRMSKAALNQFTRTAAIELGRRSATHVVSWHPGTTQTDLSAPFARNVKPESLFPVEFSVHQVMQALNRIDEQHSGGFYDWSGQSLSF